MKKKIGKVSAKAVSEMLKEVKDDALDWREREAIYLEKCERLQEENDRYHSALNGLHQILSALLG